MVVSMVLTVFYNLRKKNSVFQNHPAICSWQHHSLITAVSSDQFYQASHLPMKNCMTSVWMTLEKFGVTMPVLQQGTSLAVEIENEYNYICIENHCGVCYFYFFFKSAFNATIFTAGRKGMGSAINRKTLILHCQLSSFRQMFKLRSCKPT